MAGRPDDDEIKDQPLDLGDDDQALPPDDEPVEAEAAPEDDDQPEEVDSRRSRRDTTFRDELRAIREANARLEGELAQLRQQRQPQQPQEEDDYAFNLRLQTMTQEERVDARLQRSERRHQREMAAVQIRTMDAADKAAFEAKTSYSDSRKKLAGRVEQQLQTWRNAGLWQANREDAYRYVRGLIADENESKISQAKKQGQQRVQREQSRTASGRSDQQAPPRRQTTYRDDDRSPEAVLWRLNGRGTGIPQTF